MQREYVMKQEDFERRIADLQLEHPIEEGYVATARKDIRIIFQKYKIVGDKVELMMEYFDGWSSIRINMKRITNVIPRTRQGLWI